MRPTWALFAFLAIIFVPLAVLLIITLARKGQLQDGLAIASLLGVGLALAAWWTARTTLSVDVTGIRVGRAFGSALHVPFRELRRLRYATSVPLEGKGLLHAASGGRTAGARHAWVKAVRKMQEEGIRFERESRQGIWLHIERASGSPLRVKLMPFRPGQVAAFHRAVAPRLAPSLQTPA